VDESAAHVSGDVPGRPRATRGLTPTQPEAGEFERTYGIVWPAAQLELLDFMIRRVEACVRWPSQLTHCRSAQEVWEQQARFMEDMVRDHRSTGGRFMSAWAVSAPAASEGGKSLH
jgi:hypothetical protein